MSGFVFGEDGYDMQAWWLLVAKCQATWKKLSGGSEANMQSDVRVEQSKPPFWSLPPPSFPRVWFKSQ